MHEIETERLRLSMPVSADLDALMPILGDPEVMKYLGIEAGTTLSREETETMLGQMIEAWKRRGWGRWVVVQKNDDKVIGFCGYRLLDNTPELLYVFAKSAWGRGLATEAARATLRYGFEELQFPRIIAATRHAHTASISVMRKIGMKYEKDVNLFGVEGVSYVATPDDFQANDSTYVLSSQTPER
ncbi:MAG: GNAT family N-acetyltransferase [Pyrinomonadaceae bacterium]